MDLTLTREEIQAEGILGDKRKPDQHWDYMADSVNKIGYIRITSFGEAALREFTEALKSLEEQDAKGLVLDLRNNPGGSLETAVAMVDLLLEEGDIVQVVGRNEEPRVYQAKKEGTFFTGAKKIPITVLVNEGSASAQRDSMEPCRIITGQ